MAPKGSLHAHEIEQIRDLKKEITQLLESVRQAGDRAIQPRPDGCIVPMTPIQLLYWRRAYSNGERRTVRISSFAMRISGRLNIAQLQTSVRALIRRHESLRTTFSELDGVPIQQIGVACDCALTVTEISNGQEDIEESTQQTINELASRLIDLSEGPLLEVKLLRLSARDHVLVFAIDHMITDGMSRNIIIREIWNSYDELAHGSSISLSAPKIQLPDYAVWLKETYSSWLARSATHWSERLSATPSMKFALDEPSEQEASKEPKWSFASFCITRGVCNHLTGLARREKVHVSLVLLCAYMIAVQHRSLRRVAVAHFVSNGRWCADLENVVGQVVADLLLRVEVSSDDSFLTVLKRVREEYSLAYDHQDFFRAYHLVPGFQPDVLLNWLPINTCRGRYGLRGSDEVEIEPYQINFVTPSAANCPTFEKVFSANHYVDLSESSSGIDGRVASFGRTSSTYSLEKIARDFQTLTEKIAQYPHERIGAALIR